MTMGSCVFGEEAEEARMGTFKQATITCCLISIVMAAVCLFMLRRWHKAQLKKNEYEDELRKREDEENNAPWEENRDMEFDDTEKFDPNQLPEIATPFKWCV